MCKINFMYFHLKHDVSETGFSVRLQVEPELSRYSLKEREFILRNVVF
jgi:hypothetical protein